MKKIILLCFLIMFSLCSCGFTKDFSDLVKNEAVPKAFKYNDLSIELTSDFLTMDFVNDSYDFIWGTKTITVMGVFSEFEQSVLDTMSAKNYAEIFREQLLSSDPSEIKDLDGIPTIEYEKDGTRFLISFYKAQDGIYMVMFGADVEDYDNNYDDICKYAKSVKCN